MDKRKKKKPTATGRGSRTTPPPPQTVTQTAAPVVREVAVNVSVAGFEGSYETFVAEATQLHARDVAIFNGNAQVALQNARAGVAAVMAERARIESDPEAPEVDFAKISATARVAEALVFAANAASNAVAERSETNAQMSKVYELRDELLANAVSLVKSKVIKGKDADSVANIQKGKGAIDAAQDCIALGALFRRVARDIEGKSPITPERVREAAQAGSDALLVLAPDGVVVERSGEDPVAKAAEMRDRMAALLTRHYAYVGRIAGWLWGFNLGDHVSPLRSRSVSSGAAEEGEPQPPTPPAPTPG